MIVKMPVVSYKMSALNQNADFRERGYSNGLRNETVYATDVDD